jgi:hypothetical protein
MRSTDRRWNFSTIPSGIQIQIFVSIHRPLHASAICVRIVSKSVFRKVCFEKSYNRNNIVNLFSFLDALEKIVDSNYEPLVQDILQCRFRTTGTQEILFSYNKMDFK